MNTPDPLQQEISRILARIACHCTNGRGPDLGIAHQPLENRPGFFIRRRSQGPDGPVSCRGIKSPGACGTAGSIPYQIIVGRTRSEENSSRPARFPASFQRPAGESFCRAEAR